MNEKQFNLWLSVWEDKVRDSDSLNEPDFRDEFLKFTRYLRSRYGTQEKLQLWSRLVIIEENAEAWKLFVADTNAIEGMNRSINRFLKEYTDSSVNVAVKHVYFFMEFMLRQHREFISDPDRKKPIAWFYKTLTRTICRQICLREHIREMRTAGDIAYNCSKLIEFEIMAEKKCEGVGIFREFLRQSLITWPSLKQIVAPEILDLPNYEGRARPVRIEIITLWALRFT